MKQLFLLRSTTISFGLAVLQFAAGETLYAAGRVKLDISAKKTSHSDVELTFTAKPSEGLKINNEGPWKLEIKDQGSLEFSKSEFKRTDWDDKISGFSVIAKPSKSKTSTIKFRLTAFVCTQEKTQCFREVLEDSASVKW